ncbi:MAG: tryptophanyl-tRNA synthetase [Bradymonadia bacterium]|jgi:tryptophanyl-tRNA synthetase
MSRTVSGIQPTGELHLGNYFGALSDQADHAGPNAFYFLADLHALASGREPSNVEDSIQRATAICLATGLGRGETNIYRQSDVGAILQLQWLLATLVPLAELDIDEGVSARRQRGASVTVARANYAVLMAADVLAVRADRIIVGADQEQHVRMVRHYATLLNKRCESPVVTDDLKREPQRSRGMVLGSDGEKMSKSAHNGLSLVAEREVITAYVISLHAGESLPDRAEDCIHLNLLRHLDEDRGIKLTARYAELRDSAAATSELRDELIERLDQLMSPWRESMLEFDSNEGHETIQERLAAGADSASVVADETVRIVRSALRKKKPAGRGRPKPQPGPAALSYSDYIGVPAILGGLTPPADPPRGVPEMEWPWGQYEPSITTHGGGSLAPERSEPWRLPKLPTDHAAWAHDEVLFIATHQAFEVWFRHALFELDDLMERVDRSLEEHSVFNVEIPHSRLMRRRPERVARMHFKQTLRGHERLAELVDRIEADAANDPALIEYAEWIRETPRPGAFPDSVELPDFKLSAIEDSFPLWAERFGRVAQILRTATAFFDILRRMPPKSFLEFRSRLDPASGFGSGQYRELEIFTGQRERHFTSFGSLDAEGQVVDPEIWALLCEHIGEPIEQDAAQRSRSEAAELAARANPVLERALPEDQFMRVRARMLEPTLRDLIDMVLLKGCGDLETRRDLADRVAAANLADLYETGKRRRQHGFAHTQREREMWRVVGSQLSHYESIAATAVLADDPTFGAGDLSDSGRREFKRLLEQCLELDAALMGWRTSHLSFVELMIGARPGTGGGGLVYLAETMKATKADYVLRSFPAVWAARSLISARAL